MKRNTSSSVLLFILLYSLNVIKAQAEQVSVFEQEQAQQIANQIIVQKSLSDEKLENVNIDTEDLISRGYDAWANLEFYKAADYFKKAQMLEPYNSEISTLIYKVEQARITFERKKIELQQRIIQDERMLETDKAWLTDNPATKSVGLLQDNAARKSH
ncbi:MAG: hypothetical protein HY810_08170 [Candidatus Omnitrophica bacterium]|nr:hypothetical protein [Candidatus Omnitrophota bacterium]